MCQGDTTLVTMRWSQRGPLPIGNFSSPHQCVNWGLLMEWVKPHAFDGFAEGVMVHPKFGRYNFICSSTGFTRTAFSSKSSSVEDLCFRNIVC